MRLLAKLLLCLILGYALAVYLAIPASPEVIFWRSVNDRRDQEIAAIRQQHPEQPILFFTGGSSCAFSIDPKVIEEKCGMPAFNLGLPVSAGPKYLLHQALEKTHPGDTLVICLEPDLLTYPEDFKASQFSFAMALSARQPSAAAGGSSFGTSLSLREYLNLSRPGPGYVSTWIAKKFTGKGYRYEPKDLRYHGRTETPVSDPSLPRAGVKSVTETCPTARELLATFQTAAKQKGVRLLYSMPWILTAENAAGQNRAANLKILSSINTQIPTVDDGYQGVATDPAYFADSGLHLSAIGSSLRSKALADALQAKLKQPH
ncbi:MAG: hypothetical protein ABI600_05940 [Luteolibacter sp.]